jgi:hypothetical protein
MTARQEEAERLVRSRSTFKLDGEPSIQELIDDPVMRAMMARDGVELTALVSLIADVKSRLKRQSAGAYEAAVD